MLEIYTCTGKVHTSKIFESSTWFLRHLLYSGHIVQQQHNSNSNSNNNSSPRTAPPIAGPIDDPFSARERYKQYICKYK